MTLAPLLAASPAIQIHAFAAMAAFVIGAVQLAGPKGGALHRTLGYIWVAAMVAVAVSSFWIHEINQWNGFSLIHLLSVQVLVTLPIAVHAARRGNIGRHRFNMIGMFVGALVIAGLLTLLPGRLMHAVVLAP
jgi:uncharacterized membrane protein